MSNTDVDSKHMRRALALAERGLGCVEPNPMVGCVIAAGDRVLGEGYHRCYGKCHAEIHALHVARQSVEQFGGATMYVTLEPCCHYGKTPPCTDAILEAGLRRVVVAMSDPCPQVNGGGIATLRQAGATVEVGLLARESQRLNAPYLKRLSTGKPWVIAKWAMTLDGKIASTTGDSRWISNDHSRCLAHRLRGRVDAILVGRRTALRDDPLLTARPAGARVATRIVVDSLAQISLDSQLVQSAQSAPVMIAAGPEACAERCVQLTAAGCEVWQGRQRECSARFLELLDELGRRQFTNVLVEGGGELLGNLLDRRQIDEVHVFIAPKLLGGRAAPTPLAGIGLESIAEALSLENPQVEIAGSDVYVHGHVARRGQVST